MASNSARNHSVSEYTSAVNCSSGWACHGRHNCRPSAPAPRFGRLSVLIGHSFRAPWLPAGEAFLSRKREPVSVGEPERTEPSWTNLRGPSDIRLAARYVTRGQKHEKR
jgi:hypothetical protein